MSTTSTSLVPRPPRVRRAPRRWMLRRLERRTGRSFPPARAGHAAPARRRASAGSIRLDDDGEHSRRLRPAAVIPESAAVRAALDVAAGTPGRIELAEEFGCLVWSVEVCGGERHPIVVLVDAGSGAVSRVEHGGLSRRRR